MPTEIPHNIPELWCLLDRRRLSRLPAGISHISDLSH